MQLLFIPPLYLLRRFGVVIVAGSLSAASVADAALGVLLLSLFESIMRYKSTSKQQGKSSSQLPLAAAVSSCKSARKELLAAVLSLLISQDTVSKCYLLVCIAG
jgi:hypothetical protein